MASFEKGIEYLEKHIIKTIETPFQAGRDVYWTCGPVERGTICLWLQG